MYFDYLLEQGLRRQEPAGLKPAFQRILIIH